MGENKMGVMEMKRLILTVSAPMMISMLIQSLYNVVDSMFVAQLNEEALTAVTLALPVQNLMIAVQVGAGVGMNALLSRRLGEGRFEEANKAGTNGVFLSFIHYGIFLLAGLMLVPTFFQAQTTNEAIIQQGIDYLWIVMVFSFGKFFQFTYERLLQATGRTMYTMVTQGAGALLNIVLDWVLIFGNLGFPRLEVRGAAIATILAQIFSAGLAFYFHHTKNEDLQLNYRDFRPDLPSIRGIYSVGIPSMVQTSVISVTTFALNNILISFTPTATAVYGVYVRLQSFVFMPVFGLNNGMIPIVAYNYGAKKKERLREALRLCIFFATGILMVGLLIFQLFPEQLLSLFDASEQMLAIGVPAIRIVSSGFLLAGFSIVTAASFQAFGKGGMSLTVSLVRQMLVLIPLAYLLSLTGEVNAIWWAYPASEVASALICAYFLRTIYEKQIEPLGRTN